MQIQGKKLELVEWILHINDISMLKNIENFMLKFSKKKNGSFSNVPVYGRLKGKIVTSSDFNDTPDDFREYM